MERARRAVFGRGSSQEEYEPLTGEEEGTALEVSAVLENQDEIPFSWIEYYIFGFLGVAMLWAW